MCVRLLDVLFKFVVFFFDFLLDCFCCSVLKLSNLSLILPSIFFTSLVILTSRSLICFFIHILMFLLKLLSLWNIAKIAVLCSCILDLVCAWDFALANCWCIDLVRKIMQTHLENVKILIKLGNCLFSLLAV